MSLPTNYTLTNAQIKVRVAPTGSLQSAGVGAGVVLKNFVNDITRLDQLKDVIEPEHPAENSVLTYDAETDKYVVQTLNLDGGTF